MTTTKTPAAEALYIFSGKCVIGKVGEETALKDSFNEPLFVGDIVVIYYNNHGFNDAPTLTVIADEKYQSYSDGTTVEGASSPFVMGIKSVNHLEENSKWSVVKLKSHEHLIDGEGWPRFGFRVGKLTAAPSTPPVDGGKE